MLIRRQDLLVLLLHNVGYTRLRQNYLCRHGVPHVRFLTFHDVTADAEPAFRANLRFLKDHTNVVSLDDFMLGRLSAARINIILTFDDGYKSWLTRALPALLELGLPATFFVSSGLLDLSRYSTSDVKASHLKSYLRDNGGLTDDGVRTLAGEGFTIGGHTVNHVNMSTMRKKTDVRQELVDDKRHLEKLIGETVRYFAYPFGFHQNPNINLLGLVKQVGYSAAVTTVPGRNTTTTCRFRLKRNLTGKPMSPSVFRARALGAYDGVTALKGLSLLKDRKGSH